MPQFDKPEYFEIIYDGYETEAEAVSVRDRLAELYPDFADGLIVSCTSESTREDFIPEYGVVYESDDPDMAAKSLDLSLTGPYDVCSVHFADDCPSCDPRNGMSDDVIAELGI